MSSHPVLFDGVWKKFRSGERHDSLRDLIPSMIRSVTRRSNRADLREQEFWALKDVSFEVAPGEALGIIGPNGAGKSTILKVLTRILRPNRGSSVISGRIGALIEVAAGFHPDLTGRENVHLQGAVMGMKRAEVAAKFDEIVEFAGVADFIDTPVKRYSSGMNARLGFSIAAHLNPDVLIIDEVLSVGDVAFQEKCVSRMRRFKRDGATIVFVSHNLQAVSDLCDKALYLHREVRAFGPTRDVMDAYVRAAFASSQNESVGSTELQVRRTALTHIDGAPITEPVAAGQEVRFSVDFETKAPLNDLWFSFRVLRATDQLLVYDRHTSQAELGLNLESPTVFTVDFFFEVNLTRGQYYLEVLAGHAPTQQFLVILSPAGHLTVAEMQTWGGVANLKVRTSSRHEDHARIAEDRRTAKTALGFDTGLRVERQS
jgi:lipopolysaccharide transport system ATP-binding protein